MRSRAPPLCPLMTKSIYISRCGAKKVSFQEGALGVVAPLYGYWA